MERFTLIIVISILLGSFIYFNINTIMRVFWELVLKLINFILVLLGEDVE